jgi:hypothetical protein
MRLMSLIGGAGGAVDGGGNGVGGGMKVGSGVSYQHNHVEHR